ncbi:uncharacterized protein LOC131680600 [Topomyia yanbarensis]|uniref:uncharacterized protein LOC131680600 n=1 Tax=Topomyia yanbarensis TaxID=2498891 RepID=UPI00273CE009|nr:uncharacterized protein LOC131680600 [Topomyia yanbarensis]
MPGETLAKKDPTRWLDTAFFEKVLRQGINDKNLTVEDLLLCVHANVGEHYASTIYRANVQYRSQGKIEPIALIVKLVTSKVNKFADNSSFENEVHQYRNVINPMQDLLKQAGAENYELCPKLMFASAEPQPVIVLEDVTPRKFETYKHLLNLENSKVIAAKLAKFHAASYCLNKDVTNKNLDNHSDGLFKEKPSEGVKFMEENFEIFADELSKWNGFEKYSEKLFNLKPNFIKRGVEIFNQHNGNTSFKVLNHGDFHYNNMLVRLFADTTSVLDALFIDFQLSFWGSPAVDLFYLLYLVCDKETRENHKQELIYYYHQRFTETLRNVGHMGTPPTLFEINSDLLKFGFLEVIIAACFMPFLFADYSAASSAIGCSQDAKAYRRQLYNNPQYRELIEPLLPYFLHKGFLD